MGKNKTIARLLRRLAETLEKTPEADLEALLSGRARLVVSPAGADRRSPRQKRTPSKKITELVAKLRDLRSREDGLALLRTMRLNRRELEELARLMDLPVLRDDGSERLVQKIVEESIGARLNSEAIRGQ